jgi:heptosyltransferase-1
MEMRTMRRGLREAGYDIAIDLQGSLRSAVTMRWSDATRQIGEDRPREPVARFFYRERVRHSGAHVIEQDLELAGAIFGDRLSYVPPPFPIDSQAQAWVEETLRQNHAQRYALLLPGAGWGAKRWPLQFYGHVAAGLRKLGFHSFLNVGPGEEALGEQAQSASAGSSTAVSPTLPQLIELLRRVTLCVGGDTGPLHLACALQVPSVGIYGPTDPARNGPFYDPAKPVPHSVVRSPNSLRDHARRTAPEAGLLTITPQDVLAAIERVLSQLPSEVRS